MAVSFDQFARQVVETGLLSTEDIGDVLASIRPEQQPEDGGQLARLLVKCKALTAFQAQQIYGGKGKSLVLGNYVILDKIGQGGVGIVFKAEHKRMKRVVALKTLSPTVIQSPGAVHRFQREVEAAAKLDHPNIVTAHDADEANGTHFLVMQYVDGADLAAIVKQHGPLPVQTALWYLLQTARGLSYAHARGVIHRDIKPSNLLLDRNGTIKILDMGLARLDAASSDHDQLTGSGLIMGTADYMAPEQAVDTHQADARADIYSLGATLWYLLTGRLVYLGDTLVMRLLAHQNNPIPSLPSICSQASPQLERVLQRMLTKTPDLRYQSMSEVITDLERCLGDFSNEPSSPRFPADETQRNTLSGGASVIGDPQGTLPVATRGKEAGAIVEPTLAMQWPEVDTDFETQPALVNPPVSESVSVPSPLADHSHESTSTPHPADDRRCWWVAARGARIAFACLGGGLVVLLATEFFVDSKRSLGRVEFADPQIEVSIKGTDIVLREAAQGNAVKLAVGTPALVVQRYHESDEYRRLLPGAWIDIPLDTFASDPPDAWSLDDDALTFSGQPAWCHAQSDLVIGTDYAVRARVEALEAAGNEMSLWLRAGPGHLAVGVNWAGKHFWGGAKSAGSWRGLGTQPATDWSGWNGKPTDPIELTAVVHGERLLLFANGEQVAACPSSFGPAAGGIAISSKFRCRIRDVQAQYLTNAPSVIPPPRIVLGDARVQLTGPPGPFTVKDLPRDLQVSPRTGITPAMVELRTAAGKATDYRFTIDFPDGADTISTTVSGLLVGETWDVAYHALPDHAWGDSPPPVDVSDLGEPNHREQATELAFRWTNVATPQAPTGPFLLTASLKADFPPGWYRLRSAPGRSVRVRMDGTVVLDNWREPTIERTLEYLQVAAGEHHWQVESFQPAKNRALAVVLEPVAEEAVPRVSQDADARADRAAAEWALSLGGRVTVTVGNLNSGQQVACLDELPKAFRLVAINLSTDASSKMVDAASLRGFDRLTSLTGLDLRNAMVADAGIGHLEGCPTLRVLGLFNNQLTDEGLDHITKITTLEWLDLGNNPRVSDEGLRRLTGLSQLQWISVATTKVTESGLDELATMKTLTFIVLQGLGIGDEAIERLQMSLPKAQIVR